MAKPSKIVYGNTVILDLTSDTVAAANLLSGYTAHGRDGEDVVGACTYDADTSDATATTSDILYGETAYVNGVKVTGDMPNRGALSGTIDDVNDAITINAGYYDGSGSVTLDATEKTKIIAGNIKHGFKPAAVNRTDCERLCRKLVRRLYTQSHSPRAVFRTAGIVYLTYFSTLSGHVTYKRIFPVLLFFVNVNRKLRPARGVTEKRNCFLISVCVNIDKLNRMSV